MEIPDLSRRPIRVYRGCIIRNGYGACSVAELMSIPHVGKERLVKRRDVEVRTHHTRGSHL